MSALLNVACRRADRWFNRLAAQGINVIQSADIKTLKEAKEFVDNPSLEEAADVFISLLGACKKHGWSSYDLAVATITKLGVNEQRTWAEQPDGTYQHT